MLTQIAVLVIGNFAIDGEVEISHQPRLGIRNGDQVLMVVHLMIFLVRYGSDGICLVK